jgi:hypothetical protein
MINGCVRASNNCNQLVDIIRVLVIGLLFGSQRKEKSHQKLLANGVQGKQHRHTHNITK